MGVMRPMLRGEMFFSAQIDQNLFRCFHQISPHFSIRSQADSRRVIGWDSRFVIKIDRIG